MGKALAVFAVGLATGIAGVVLYNNRDKIAERFSQTSGELEAIDDFGSMSQIENP